MKPELSLVMNDKIESPENPVVGKLHSHENTLSPFSML